MTTNVQNVVAGKPLATGGVWSAPLGTALPTDESTALDGAFVSGGYIGEDGLSETQDRSTTKVRAWGGDTVKVLQTEFSLTYSFTYIESVKDSVLSEVYGSANVTTNGGKHTVKVTSDQLPHRTYVFEVKDGDARIRIVVPDGQITEIGEVVYSDGDVIGYPVTVEAFRHSGTSANAVKYIDPGAGAGSSSSS